MIFISQGHESGIGLEVFIKSFLCLDQNFQKKFKLFCIKETLLSNLDELNISYKLANDKINICNSVLNIEFLNKPFFTQSDISLKKSINQIKENDILITLPTSKDQFSINNFKPKGHTEFFRKYYSQDDLCMTFISDNFNALLLTDHISISDVEKKLSKEYIINKVSICLDNIHKVSTIDEIIFSGVNPHNSEDGLMGYADKYIIESIKVLSAKYSQYSFKGPIPGDTIHTERIKPNKLFIYSFHDQGLAPFKLYNGLVGMNITLGLPFVRYSVDHGTAFNIAGKNQANYIGMLYLLRFLQKKTQA